MISTRSVCLAALCLATASVAAVNVTDITADGCVDSSGMTSCTSDADGFWSDCLSKNKGDETGLQACDFVHQINYMNCYMTSCWNKVYSCAYQNLAMQYLIGRDLAHPSLQDVPFFPIPSDVHGLEQCSCNIGSVYDTLTEALSLSVSNCTQFVTGDGSDMLEQCSCCGFSAATDAYFSICPNTDPRPDPLGIEQLISAIESYQGKTGNKCSGDILKNCDQFGYGLAKGGKFIDPNNLPPFPSGLLSETGSAITSAPGGATLSWSALGTEYTITAAPFDKKNAQSSSSSSRGSKTTSGGGSSSSGGSAESTGSGGAAAATGSGGSAAATGSGGAGSGSGQAGKPGAASSVRVGGSMALLVGAVLVLAVAL